MKIRRKTYLQSNPAWAELCRALGKELDSVFTAQGFIAQGMVRIDGLEGLWNISGFDTVSDERNSSKPKNKPVYKIFKYTLPIAERTHIDLPLGAQILRVDGLDGGLWVWAMVDTTAPLERREFALFKTGGDMPDNVAEEYKYVGCGSIYIQQELMLYVFEKVSRE